MIRQPVWLKQTSEKVFLWHHIPAGLQNDTAVIIIGPIGPEYMPCHRSLKILADQLCQIGLHCVRYDHIGMGNSSGELRDESIWQKWLTTPVSISQYLRNNFKIKNIIVIGVRSGALLMQEVLNDDSTRSGIFWYPFVQGKSFLRGIKLLDSVLYADINSVEANLLEGGGYPITDKLINDLKGVNLLSGDYSKLKHSLIINSKDSKHDTRLYEALSQSNVDIDELHLEGLTDMIKQVTLSKIPNSNIKAICEWVNNLVSSNNIEIKTNELKAVSYVDSDFEESTIMIENHRKIFGVITKPKSFENNELILIVNTGAAHQVGPNRIHVEIARNLAKQGVTTLRIDLSNLGDSAEVYAIDPPMEYPESSTEDINYVIDYLSENYQGKNIVLCGISSGAHNIFHAALNCHNFSLRKIILINPETFYWSPDLKTFSVESSQNEKYKAYYLQQILKFEKWILLMLNPKKIFNMFKFIFFYICNILIRFVFRILRLVGFNISEALEKDIRVLDKKNITLALVYSQGEHGVNILKSQASRALKELEAKNHYVNVQVDDADHTFSSIASRQGLYRALERIILDS